MLVAYCRLCRHCRYLAEGGCLLSRFHFTRCCHFLGHVAFRNLPWQGLMYRNPPSQLFFQFTIIMRGRWWSIIPSCSRGQHYYFYYTSQLIHDSWYTFVTIGSASKQMKFVLSGISAALWVPRLNIISPNLWQPIRIEKELIIMLKYPFFCCNIKKTCIAVGHVSETLHSSFSIYSR